MNDVTILLNQRHAGEAAASDQLMVVLYTELREQAVRQLSSEKPGHTLQATALVHEAYLRLVGPAHVDSPDWNSRGHFFAAAAEAMRRRRLSVAYFAAGIQALADGRPASEVARYFQDCVDKGYYLFYTYAFSRAMAKRFENEVEPYYWCVE